MFWNASRFTVLTSDAKVPAAEISAEPLPPGDPSREYSRRLKTQNCREWMVLTLEIYRKSQLAKEKKRRLGSVDERTWKQAELLLHGELATALGLTLEELPGYIARRLENN